MLASSAKALIGDVGGTNTRLGVCTAGQEVQHVHHFRNHDYEDLPAVIRDYLAAAPMREALQSAWFAIAGPVQDEAVTLTNLDWHIAATDLAATLAIGHVHLLNDFQALAAAIPALSPGDVLPLGGGAARSGAPRVVLGPGTGLGVAALVNGTTVLAGEGGHVTLPARDDDEAALLARLRQQYGHVSAERVVSGPGLTVLFQARFGSESAPSSREICAGARDGDAACAEVLELMFGFLGTLAGDAALTLGAQGGVYLAGSLLADNRDLLLASGFRQRFEAKGRFRDYLRAIPTWLITRPDPALLGLSRLAGAAANDAAPR